MLWAHLWFSTIIAQLFLGLTPRSLGSHASLPLGERQQSQGLHIRLTHYGRQSLKNIMKALDLLGQPYIIISLVFLNCVFSAVGPMN